MVSIRWSIRQALSRPHRDPDLLDRLAMRSAPSTPTPPPLLQTISFQRSCGLGLENVVILKRLAGISWETDFMPLDRIAAPGQYRSTRNSSMFYFNSRVKDVWSASVSRERPRERQKRGRPFSEKTDFPGGGLETALSAVSARMPRAPLSSMGDSTLLTRECGTRSDAVPDNFL